MCYIDRVNDRVKQCFMNLYYYILLLSIDNYDNHIYIYWIDLIEKKIKLVLLIDSNFLLLPHVYCSKHAWDRMMQACLFSLQILEHNVQALNIRLLIVDDL